MAEKIYSNTTPVNEASIHMRAVDAALVREARQDDPELLKPPYRKLASEVIKSVNLMAIIDELPDSEANDPLEQLPIILDQLVEEAKPLALHRLVVDNIDVRRLNSDTGEIVVIPAETYVGEYYPDILQEMQTVQGAVEVAEVSPVAPIAENEPVTVDTDPKKTRRSRFFGFLALRRERPAS